ncbi:MAG: 3-hydroxyacyl-CoA dehydrogenase NAD-binding domain-containing protein [Burkholderiales bacterium]
MKHFRIEHDSDDLVWVTFDKADDSTNTLAAEVMDELSELLDELRNQSLRGLIIRSGKTNGFIAGADVAEFTAITTPDDAMTLVRRGWKTFEKLASLPFPTVALIKGFCMGGGLELALACRYRVAVDDPGTRFALPEVLLGIIPAWGGMKRLPRLVGPAAALDLMLTGKSIDARRARRIGLVDESVPERVMDNAARAVALQAREVRKLPFSQNFMMMPLIRKFIANTARKEVGKRARREHYPAPYSIIEHWEKVDGDPFAVEPADPLSIASIAQHPTTRNLIRIFGLQERLKSLGKTSGFAAKHVHVIGAGTMGGDIAAWCVLRGLTVTLQDQDAERLAPAMSRAAELFDRRLRDRLRVRDALDRLIPDVTGAGVRRADVIIEAIFENLAVKQALFATAEGQAKADAILATNTSSLKLADIGANMRDPTRLVGIHFFNPVAQLQLVEVVAGERTDKRWADDAAAFVRAIDKLPLPVRDAPGFLVNRVLGPYMAAAFRMLEEGIQPEALDKAATDFGMPMGPIELADVVGLDICLAAGRSIGGNHAEPPARLAKLVDAKKLGKKSGEGFYRWQNGKAMKTAARNIPPRVIERLISPYIAEAKKAVAEGIVSDADLADAGLIFGTGFAPFRGGPLHYAAAQTTATPALVEQRLPRSP